MTQAEALAILKTGANIFLTGEPGSGKTHTVNSYISYLRDHKIEPSVTASTGIAATHVGGMTIHSWSGVGIHKSLSPYELDALMGRESLVKRLNSAHVLIIDEISMLDASVLDTVELVVRTVRGRSEPFGGLQVIFVGDFFQLPPISERGEERAAFAFLSRAWKEANPITCYLSEQHRQEDGTYLSALSLIRGGDVDESIYELLQTRFSEEEPDEDITRLFTHNADVDRMNETALSRIEGTRKTYSMEGVGNAKLLEGLRKNCLSPETLTLKVGATVMFTKNNFEAGFVNGTLGTVVDFDSVTHRPVVKTRGGKTIVAETMEWALEDSGKVLAKIIQIPLRLAWAITVHKSQGMSLDAAHMDLSRAFEYGQGYVALSRVRTLEGLFLKGINARALEVHPQVRANDARFKDQSAQAVETFASLSPEALLKMHNDAILFMGGTLAVEKKEKKEVLDDEGKPKKTMDDVRKKYPNAGRPWSKEDSDEMVRKFEAGESKTVIARHFGRKPTAIHARLVQLGIIEEESVFEEETS